MLLQTAEGVPHVWICRPDTATIAPLMIVYQEQKSSLSELTQRHFGLLDGLGKQIVELSLCLLLSLLLALKKNSLLLS